MRALFCGSGRCAVPSLRAITKAGHEVVGVVTQPARPAGRGGKLRRTPAAEAADDAGLNVIECGNINAEDSVSLLRSLGADVMCVVDFGQLIRRPARETARLGAFNMHGSLLPALRGAAPINWAIIRGHRRTGATTFRLTDGMDSGPIYLQASLEIGREETAGELLERIAAVGADLVCRTLEILAAGGDEPTPQDESRATLAPRLTKADGRIDWSADAEAVGNLVRGTWPWPAARTLLSRRDGARTAVAIARAVAAGGQATGAPGEVDGEGLVSTGRGRLALMEIRPAGKRLMSWGDFVNGYRVGEGDRFVAVEEGGDEQEPA
jgi:methionyl-tRNA formyltransferase